jgi:DNA-binding GntR family transcriptional regulator
MKSGEPVSIVYEYIKGKIISKALFPGNRIIEEEIADETGISRTSIRTALLKLSYTGFIDIKRNHGAFVSKPTFDEVKMIYDARIGLENTAVRLSIGHYSDNVLRALEKNMAEQTQLLKSYSVSKYIELNQEFHQLLTGQTGNLYIEKYLNELYNKIHIFILFFDTSVDNKESLDTHWAILDGIKKGDIESVEKAIYADSFLGVRDIKDTIDNQ